MGLESRFLDSYIDLMQLSSRRRCRNSQWMGEGPVSDLTVKDIQGCTPNQRSPEDPARGSRAKITADLFICFHADRRYRLSPVVLLLPSIFAMSRDDAFGELLTAGARFWVKSLFACIISQRT
jgi:hypothetical protein